MKIQNFEKSKNREIGDEKLRGRKIRNQNFENLGNRKTEKLKSRKILKSRSRKIGKSKN